jgi:hypothetical protein
MMTLNSIEVEGMSQRRTLTFLSVTKELLKQQAKNIKIIEDITSMQLNCFDEVYQILNEKFINEIIDSESDKLMGCKETPINFLMLGESEVAKPS